MTRVTPIGADRRARVIAATGDKIAFLATRLDLRLPAPAIRFDLTGGAAGMYRVSFGERVIRYNPYLFAKYFSDNLKHTVAHEVAHYAVDCVHGLARVKPHGVEWRVVMTLLGVAPERTCRYDLSGVPVRRQRRFAYTCPCMPHQLTTRRHNRVARGEATYLCRRCGGELKPAAALSG